MNLEKLTPISVDRCGGLEKSIDIAAMAKVMLRRNLSVPDKLANGATGNIVGWVGDPAVTLPKAVLIHFDRIKGELVGQAMRKASKHQASLKLQKQEVVPIEPVTAQ
ncbi:MAG: hypothetical protein GY696_17435, partial [Gammaproteobacteria bacterium]|nr:hypothetical protein [Gammaproteobacteria bacterium]